MDARELEGGGVEMSKDSKNDAQERNMWSDYIQGKLSPSEEKRLDMLVIDDIHAFQMYTQELERYEGDLPKLPNREHFTDQIMRGIPESYEIRENKQSLKTTAQRNRTLPIYHYLIAASITLFLLGSGVFDMLSEGANRTLDKSVDTSISDQWMNATTKWIDSLRDDSTKK